MKRFFALILSLSLLLGMTACSTQEQGWQFREKQIKDCYSVAYTWFGEAETEKPPEMLRNLTEEATAAVLSEAFAEQRIFDTFDFHVLRYAESKEYQRLQIVLKATYREWNKNNNASIPLFQKKFQMELPLEMSFSSYNGVISETSVELTGLDPERWDEPDNHHNILYDLPDLKETGTFTAILYELKDQDLFLTRMFLVEDGYGYMPDGYFLIHTYAMESMPVDKTCEISYYTDLSAMESVPISEFEDFNPLSYKIYYVTRKDGVIVQIEERRP